MKELYKFKSLKEIDDCEEVSRALESVGKIPHIQEVLFDRIDCEFKTTDVQQFVNTL
jgi:C4-type Zn-finger protein